MERDTEGHRREDEATDDGAGHGFAETLPADGAGWEAALAAERRPAADHDETTGPGSG